MRANVSQYHIAPKQIGPTYAPEGWARWEQSPKMDFGGVRQRDDLGPTAWNCHLHPSLRFSGSSNHLIHAFLAVASLGNLCPPKLLHLGTQHCVPRLFLLRLSMMPTATHQQDNSYGRSAIWRVSKFVIPLIGVNRWIMLALIRREQTDHVIIVVLTLLTQ